MAATRTTNTLLHSAIASSRPIASRAPALLRSFHVRPLAHRPGSLQRLPISSSAAGVRWFTKSEALTREASASETSIPENPPPEVKRKAYDYSSVRPAPSFTSLAFPSPQLETYPQPHSPTHSPPRPDPHPLRKAHRLANPNRRPRARRVQRRLHPDRDQHPDNLAAGRAAAARRRVRGPVWVRQARGGQGGGVLL